MSMVEQLRDIAKTKHFQHEHRTGYDPKNRMKRKDFFESEVADELARLKRLERAGKYLSAEVKDCWQKGRISIDALNAAYAFDEEITK